MILGAYGSSQINIGLNVHLRDNFSGPAAQVKAAFGSLKDELKMYQENLRAARNMYGQLFAAGSIATMGMAAMYKSGAKFDYTIRGVAAAAGSTNTEFKQLFDIANKIGGTTMFTPTEVAQSMRELSLAGFDTKATLTAIDPIVNLAGASMTNLATSAQIAINTMYQFNKSAKDMGSITDLLTYASNKSAINLTDLGESLKYVSATGVDLGQSLPQVLSMLMVLGNAGLKGSLAGVALENMMRYMALGLGEYGKTGRAKSWEAFGLNPKDLVTADGDLKPVADIFKAMSKAAGTMGDVDKQNLLYQVFNVRGKRAASKLLQAMSQWETYSKGLEGAVKNPGFAQNIMGFMMGGPEGSIQRMHGAWLGFMNEFTQAVAPLATVILTTVTGITKLMTLFTSNPLGRIITDWIAGLIVVKTAIWGLKFAFASVALSQSYLRGSFEGVKTAMATGWQQLTGQVLRYNSTLLATQVITNRAMGFRPAAMTAANAAALGLGGYFVGGAGRVFRGMAGGGVMRTAAGTMVNRNLLPAGLGAGVGRNLWLQRTAGAGALAGIAGTMGKTVGVKGAGLIAGRGLSAFLGGPWGIAITALTFLPAIISGLTSSTDTNTAATQANTAATQTAGDDMRVALSSLANFAGTTQMQVRKLYKETGESGADIADYILERRKREYLDNPNRYGNREFYDMSQKGIINIYYQGQLKETIAEELNKQINVNLGL